MDSNVIYEIIERAINDKKELIINMKYASGHGRDTLDDLSFQPYILGDDTMQFGFVWGYLSSNHLYYKILLENIITAKLTSRKFDVKDDACYQYIDEESHFAMLDKFKNYFRGPARIANS